MNDDDLMKWRDLAAKATPGPWRVSDGRYDSGDVVQANPPSAIGGRVVGSSSGPGDDGGCDPDDAAFIAAAREAVPALIAEVDRLRGVVRMYESLTLNPVVKPIALGTCTAYAGVPIHFTWAAQKLIAIRAVHVALNDPETDLVMSLEICTRDPSKAKIQRFAGIQNPEAGSTISDMGISAVEYALVCEGSDVARPARVYRIQSPVDARPSWFVADDGFVYLKVEDQKATGFEDRVILHVTASKSTVISAALTYREWGT